MFFLKPKEEQLKQQKAVYSKFLKHLGLASAYFVLLKGLSFYFDKKKN